MKFVLLHGSSVSAEKVEAVVKAISRTCKLLDDTDKAYLFEGDKAVAAEVIDGMIGDFSITPVKEFALPSTRMEIERPPESQPAQQAADILEESRPKQEYVVGSCFDD